MKLSPSEVSDIQKMLRTSKLLRARKIKRRRGRYKHDLFFALEEGSRPKVHLIRGGLAAKALEEYWNNQEDRTFRIFPSGSIVRQIPKSRRSQWYILLDPSFKTVVGHSTMGKLKPSGHIDDECILRLEGYSEIDGEVEEELTLPEIPKNGEKESESPSNIISKEENPSIALDILANEAAVRQYVKKRIDLGEYAEDELTFAIINAIQVTFDNKLIEED